MRFSWQFFFISNAAVRWPGGFEQRLVLIKETLAILALALLILF
jgi:hypothetical protein